MRVKEEGKKMKKKHFIRDISDDEEEEPQPEEQEEQQEETADDDEPQEYEVELILNHKKVGKTYEYFVHWLGYPPSDDSWVPAQNMACNVLVENYWKSVKKGKEKKKKPKSKSRVRTPSPVPSDRRSPSPARNRPRSPATARRDVYSPERYLPPVRKAKSGARPNYRVDMELEDDNRGRKKAENRKHKKHNKSRSNSREPADFEEMRRMYEGVDPNSLFEDVKEEPENEQEPEGQLQQGPDGELKIRIKKSEAFERLAPLKSSPCGRTQSPATFEGREREVEAEENTKNEAEKRAKKDAEKRDRKEVEKRAQPAVRSPERAGSPAPKKQRIIVKLPNPHSNKTKRNPELDPNWERFVQEATRPGPSNSGSSRQHTPLSRQRTPSRAASPHGITSSGTPMDLALHLSPPPPFPTLPPVAEDDVLPPPPPPPGLPPATPPLTAPLVLYKGNTRQEKLTSYLMRSLEISAIKHEARKKRLAEEEAARPPNDLLEMDDDDEVGEKTPEQIEAERKKQEIIRNQIIDTLDPWRRGFKGETIELVYDTVSHVRKKMSRYFLVNFSFPGDKNKHIFPVSQKQINCKQPSLLRVYKEKVETFLKEKGIDFSNEYPAPNKLIEMGFCV